MLKYNVLKEILNKLKITEEILINRLNEIGQRQSALNLKNWNEVDENCSRYLEKALSGLNNNSSTETNW